MAPLTPSDIMEKKKRKKKAARLKIVDPTEEFNCTREALNFCENGKKIRSNVF